MEEKPIIDLINSATAAREKAYAPYSQFKVGAAVRCVDKNVFTGCNVENASFGATLCAERVALAKAISEGSTKIEVLVVVTDAPGPTPPCGICRQVLAEFAPQATIVMANLAGDLETTTCDALLPRSFSLPGTA